MIYYNNIIFHFKEANYNTFLHKPMSDHDLYRNLYKFQKYLISRLRISEFIVIFNILMFILLF